MIPRFRGLEYSKPVPRSIREIVRPTTKESRMLMRTLFVGFWNGSMFVKNKSVWKHISNIVAILKKKLKSPSGYLF